MNAIIILSLLLKVVVSQPQLRIPPPDDSLHIYALPVGQGDCTVIQCPRAKGDPDKGRVTIIDAGSSTGNVGINGKDVAKFLAGTQIRYVLLTHTDTDHLNYLDKILDSYQQPVPVFHPCTWNKYSCFINSMYAVHHEVPRCVNIASCRNVFPVLDLCPNQPNNANRVTLSVVASAYGNCKGNKAHNEDSLVVKITYGQTSTLITGDFEQTESYMKTFLRTAGTGLKSDIYKLSHHGAIKANQEQFLKAVGADYVFSSSGYKYGHPRCEIFDYYNQELDDSVSEHPYTCYDVDKKNPTNKKNPRNEKTKKPIYVTSLIKNGKKSYLIKFNIDQQSKISVDWVIIKK